MEKTNFFDPKQIKDIESKSRYNSIDICITTFNRLSYLQKCINSILATKKIKGKIIVHDDGSDDGSLKWLKMMEKRGKIDKVLSGKLGTAKAFNSAFNETTSKLVLFSNDDMYFYRFWDYAILNIFNKAKNCGIVTIYDYARVSLDKNNVDHNNDFSEIFRSGMGCSAVRSDIFKAVKGFNLQGNNKMGYFATSFCNKVKNMEKNFPFVKHYLTTPNFAVHIDHPNHILCDRDILKKYCDFRGENKKGTVDSKWLDDYDFTHLRE